MHLSGSKTLRLTSLLLAASFLFFLGGCAELNLGGPSTDATAPAAPPPASAPAATEQPTASSQPYYPTDFKDLLVPGELTWNRDKSMSIRTDSFAGGILNFTGRVEVNSLTDFFQASMVNNGWKMTGSIKQKSNLLVFIKPHKTCMVTIANGDFGIKTQVNIYVAEEIAANPSGAAAAPAAAPTAEEVFK